MSPRVVFGFLLGLVLARAMRRAHTLPAAINWSKEPDGVVCLRWHITLPRFRNEGLGARVVDTWLVRTPRGTPAPTFADAVDVMIWKSGETLRDELEKRERERMS